MFSFKKWFVGVDKLVPLVRKGKKPLFRRRFPKWFFFFLFVNQKKKHVSGEEKKKTS